MSEQEVQPVEPVTVLPSFNDPQTGLYSRVHTWGLGSSQRIRSNAPGSFISVFSLYEAHDTDNRLAATNKIFVFFNMIKYRFMYIGMCRYE